MIRRASFSFLLSVVIHLIAMLIIALFMITTSEELSNYVRVEFLRMSQPQKPKRRILPKRIITKLNTLPVPKIPNMFPQKLPSVWTAALPETYHQRESLALPPMPSVPVTSSSFISPIQVNFKETKKMFAFIKSSKSLSLSRFEPKCEELPELSSMIESMTLSTAEPAPQDALSPYLKEVRQKIESVKKYPSAARKFEIEGTVYVQFTILSDGNVEEVEVARSSGYETLDKAAVLAIKDAAPFSSFPKAIRRESLRIELPLAFKLLEPE